MKLLGTKELHTTFIHLKYSQGKRKDGKRNGRDDKEPHETLRGEKYNIQKKNNKQKPDRMKLTSDRPCRRSVNLKTKQ